VTSKNPRGWDESATEMTAEPVRGSHVLFDVTVVRRVGSVYAGGDQSPRQAAFAIVANDSADDTSGEYQEYSFPSEDGGRVTVTVTNEGPR
jgi:hypothetical protein